MSFLRGSRKWQDITSTGSPMRDDQSVRETKIGARNEHFQRSSYKRCLHFTKAHRQEASQLHVPTDTQTVRVPLVWLLKSWMPGFTTLGSVVASGAGYASHAFDPPSAVLQRPQPASYDRHRASYCAESTRFWNGTFETEGEPQNIFSHECCVVEEYLRVG